MHDLDALRLQIEWGADEALSQAPLDRFGLPSAPGAATSPPTASRRPGPPATPLKPVARGADLPQAAAQAAAAAATLPDLLAAIDAFHACPLRATASTTVAPSGDPEAGLVLIGPAPGPDDDRSGHAYSGPVGAQLDRVLASAGLDRRQLLLATLIPWRPPGGRPVNDAELAACLPFLHRLLTLTRPRRLVLMGASAARALGPDPAATRRLRGKWTAVTIPGLLEPIPALSMLSPETWLNSPADREKTWIDLLTLKSALDVPS